MAHPYYGSVAGAGLSKNGWHNEATNELVPGFQINSTDVVLDVGCGDGHLLRFIEPRCAHCFGVDVLESKINLLKAKLGLRFNGIVIKEGEPLPFPAGLFDKVVCTEVLEHADDPAFLVAEMRRILKTDGKILISVPGELSEIMVRPLVSEDYWKKPNHVRIFSEDSIRNLIKDGGLRIEHFYRSNAFWSFWVQFAWETLPDFDNEVRNPLLDKLADFWAEAEKIAPKSVAELNKAFPKSIYLVARK